MLFFFLKISTKDLDFNIGITYYVLYRFHIDLCSLRFLITSETFFHTDYPGFRSGSVWR